MNHCLFCIRLFLLGAVLFLLGCRTDASGQYKYQIPQFDEEELQVGEISGAALDTNQIFKALKRIEAGKYAEVHSILIYKDGKLVLEDYFRGHDYNWDGDNFWGEEIIWDKDQPHHIMSDTKSITAALIGIAIDRGFISSVDEPIFAYLPDYQSYAQGGRENITIEHLLTMTSGIEGNEWISSYRDLENPIIRLWLCEDPIQCILENRMVAEPGSKFSYWGGNQILLGEILHNAAGMDIHSFAQKYLFGPMGIKNSEWLRINDGPYDAAGGLKLTPRSMLKIGITFLNNGRWSDQQLISKNWVIRSQTPYRGNRKLKVPGEKSWRHGYSYGWWTRDWKDKNISTFFAGGWGGQNIMIVPKAKMVVVFTGGNYTSIPPPKRIMDKYIIPALNLDSSK